MPFELRSPQGLWLLGLLVPLVALYILKIRRQRLRVASTWLWAEAQRDLLAKSPFKRLIVQVPLVLQLLALCLLALALARPATRGGSIVGDHVAIVVDTSASMGAVDAGGRRIDRARQAALDLVASMSPGSDAMIVEAARDARVVSPLDRDRRRLEAAIGQLDARDVEGHLGRAIAVASDRLRRLPGSSRIVVITDGALANPDALAATKAEIDVVRVGQEAENAAIVRFDVRTGVNPTTKKEEVQAFALVTNFGASPRDVFVTLRQRNVKEPLASRRLTLAPKERAPVVLSFESVRGDLGSGILVELSPGDALPADDRAYARVPEGRKIPVVLAPADGSPWVRRALLADPDVELMGSTLEGLATAEVPAGALVVLDGACPTNPPGGDLLIVNPPAGRCYTVTVGKELEAPSLTSWSESDARLRFLTLDGVELATARQLEVDGPADALVTTREGVVVADASAPGRTGTILGFDPGDTNWPLKASFVLFVRNVVEAARSQRTRGVQGAARTGEALRVRVPSDVTTVALESPGSKDRTHVVARDGLAIVPDVQRAGFYFATWEQPRPGHALVAANLTSEAESDLSHRELPQVATVGATTNADDVADAFTDWTWILALLALGLIVADAWWLTRRRRDARLPGAGTPKLPDRRAPSATGAARGTA